ncbi:hypothetical protein ABT299_12770 [Spirillospora sp. NPDC000708]
MERVVRTARYAFGTLPAALAAVAAAVAGKQILNNDKWMLAWVLPALAFTVLGLVLANAP